jgi:exosortase
MRLVWLPIGYLVFAMPVSARAYRSISLPLQNFAAKVSTAVLQIAGVEIRVTSSHMYVTSISQQVHELTVAEACSGVRSLMAYVALAVAWAYLEDRPVWQRIVIVVAAVPVAIFCNVLRVLITCTMYVIDRPELGQGVMHEFAGMVMLVPALGLLWLLSVVMNSLFIEDDDVDDAEGDGAPGGAAS